MHVVCGDTEWNLNNLNGLVNKFWCGLLKLLCCYVKTVFELHALPWRRDVHHITTKKKKKAKCRVMCTI